MDQEGHNEENNKKKNKKKAESDQSAAEKLDKPPNVYRNTQLQVVFCRSITSLYLNPERQWIS